MVIGIIAGVIGIGSAIAGAVGANEQASQARGDNDRLLDQQFEQDKKAYEFNWNESLREYDYLLKNVEIRRAEEETVGLLKDQMSLDQYKYNLAIRDYEFLNSLRQYKESEKIYGMQLSYNQQAAEQAAQSEYDKLRETVMASAFENQDMMVEMMQEQGAVQARGVSGRSTKKQLQSAMAQFGRNQAVLAESLVSAKRQTGRSLQDISINKFGADMAAEANRMLLPMRGPDIPVPYKTPRATFQDPVKPKKGPEPVRGVNTALRPSGLGIASAALGGISSAINTGYGQWWTNK